MSGIFFGMVVVLGSAVGSVGVGRCVVRLHLSDAQRKKTKHRKKGERARLFFKF